MILSAFLLITKFQYAYVSMVENVRSFAIGSRGRLLLLNALQGYGTCLTALVKSLTASRQQPPHVTVAGKVVKIQEGIGLKSLCSCDEQSWPALLRYEFPENPRRRTIPGLVVSNREIVFEESMKTRFAMNINDANTHRCRLATITWRKLKARSSQYILATKCPNLRDV